MDHIFKMNFQLLWTKFKNESWKNARKPHKFYTCLCQVVHIYNTPAQSHKAEKQSKAASCVLTMTNEKRRPMVHLLWFYLRDNHLHLLLPLAFFIGLFEAFMAKEFIMVSQNTALFFLSIEMLTVHTWPYQYLIHMEQETKWIRSKIARRVD